MSSQAGSKQPRRHAAAASVARHSSSVARRPRTSRSAVTSPGGSRQPSWPSVIRLRRLPDRQPTVGNPAQGLGIDRAVGLPPAGQDEGVGIAVHRGHVVVPEHAMDDHPADEIPAPSRACAPA